VKKRERASIEFFSNGVKEKYTFNTERERDDAYEIIHSLWISTHSDPRFAKTQTSHNLRSLKDQEDPETLTQTDWEFLFQGSKMQSFDKNQTILSEGEHGQKIYQIASGTCRIEKPSIGKTLATMEQGQTFGEISFLLSGGATASVIADSTTVDIYILEGYFLNILFTIRPELAGRFYKYLAITLQKRLRERENK